MLNDGDPAHCWDIWLRNITDKNYVRSDGRPKNNAFTGRGAIQPPANLRPWDHELSGRLLSLTIDFEQEGAAFCRAMSRPFIGVFYASVETLRKDHAGFGDSTQNSNIRTDVHYTPNQDTAHADLTSCGTTDETLFAIRDWLQDVVSVARASPCEIRSDLPKKP